MNHQELLTLIQSYKTIFTFLVDHGLLAARRECDCGQEMMLRERPNTQDGYHWECSARQCRKRRSIRAGSFFEHSKISLALWLYVIFLWSIEEQSKQLAMLTGLSLRAVTTALQELRNICSLKILHGHITLAGRGKTFRNGHFSHRIFFQLLNVCTV